MHDHLLISVENGVGTIVMNRPDVLNALTVPMIRTLHATLDEWRDNPSVKAVILKGTGKAFCSGGDIVAVQKASIAGETGLNETFFREEYDLNHAISIFPKPYISLIDGYCMGGGMGVCIHGSYRVVTERAMMAMPETAIGFFPDVGGTHFLPRLPGRIGMYLGLTGVRIPPADAIYCGLATHYIPSEKLTELEAAIHAQPDNAVNLLNDFSESPGPSEMEKSRIEIDTAFGGNCPQQHVQNLRNLSSDWAASTLKAMLRVSPHAMRLSADLIAAGIYDNLRTCLDRELNVTEAATRHPDFIEGVRSVLVDKDRNPQWVSEPIV
jgi:enoyl-CoA hydratase